MQTMRFNLRPQTAFGTPLSGDTLFGQLCWVIRRRFGNERLKALLDGYAAGKPFAVISDAFPQGFLPLPSVPSSYWAKDDTADRKALKKKRWLPLEKFESPFTDWQNLAYSDTEAADALFKKRGTTVEKLQTIRSQPHNTINRSTSTTGEGRFAPYGMAQTWFHPEICLDLYAVIDETRIMAEELATALDDMGLSGYGRDASIGLGKFKIGRDHAFSGFPAIENANAFLTLAPCAPQGLGFDAEKSFYQLLTRFGRHGDIAVHSGQPFKHPLLLAKTGGVFTPEDGKIGGALYIGQGLGGVSPVLPETLAQGYAPVISIRVESL